MFLASAIKTFRTYKSLGERAMGQIADVDLFWQAHPDSNSIAIIVNHLWGNMLSRWTDFLTSDGEKPWRKRDEEFEQDSMTRGELLLRWEEGWSTLFRTLESLQESDLAATIHIRGEGLSVTDAIHRQLTHYAYHVGQIVFIARMRATEWTSLSVPKGGTAQFNAQKFAQSGATEHGRAQ